MCAISAVFCWIYLYTLNEDSTFMEYKKYYHEKFDKYPMLSLCFKNPFNNSILEQLGTNVNATTYLEFLEGKYFNTDMMRQDYQKIKLNIVDYVINTWSSWRNLSSKLYYVTNDECMDK